MTKVGRVATHGQDPQRLRTISAAERPGGLMSPVPPDEPALALAIDFLNTYDTLESPPDRLSVDLVQRLGSRHGHVVTFAADDLEPLRALRERLRPVFAADGVGEKVAAINGVLADATAQLDADRLRLR